MDQLAPAGVIFRNFYATDTPCFPSRIAFLVVDLASMLVLSITVASMLTCQIKVKIANFAHETLVSILRQVGYHTVSISPFPNRNTACQI
ncbi:hypothetical protein CMK13_05055 [Candidatus Poribacteria bacterium]|nr:hypothetical protein [Candidatus Poribacteria bacterium]OUT64346.1 MAG: hypothetical protein CBB75_04760 [bacterium TMED15]